MSYKTKAVAALLALAGSGALVACGSDDESVSGEFAVVADAPSGYEELSGEARLERTGGGTEASIELSGLQPDTEYAAHVHAAGCDQPDPGGPHFQFDPNGSDMPPNEIHLSFASNADGEGEAEASNDREIPDGDAGSIVVHLAEPEDAMSGEEHGSAMGREEDGGATKSDEHGEAMEGGGHSHSDKVACAELEGGSAASSEAEEGDATKREASSNETIVVRNGEPVGGVRELEYDAGERVRFEVRSDVADEVHVHGYDLMKDVAAGGTVSFSFPADIEGIFEVELEGLTEQIAELRVNP